ncbi:MAG: deoxyribodipyrimidine photo-lyase [Caldilineaceae bacterium]
MTTTIWWVRRDLRLTDNQALHAAHQQGETVIPLFILDPAILQSAWAGERRVAFLLAGLRQLDADLQARGSRLIVRKGDPHEVLATLREEVAYAAIHAERDHSPYAVRRDAEIADNLPLTLHEGVAIRPVGSVCKADGDPYVVYTPYSRQWQSQPIPQRADILPAPPALTTPAALPSQPLPATPGLPADISFAPGEAEAKRRLRAFVQGDAPPIYDYAQERDRPDLNGTAQLSPYLRFGMVSARLAALGAYTAIARIEDQAKRQSAAVWLSELIWRDFYITILAHFPHVRDGAFHRRYDQIAWENDPTHFQAWCDGRTGYPFVDAAMRQLRTLGWMHNRARMIVASFLAKDLLIDWRWGERWFMQQLLDGDPAANNGGWQWAAGTGTDAAPYFRIFNPITQGKKFDPEGDYVCRWLPELTQVPRNRRHEPWKMSAAEQKRAHCVLGQDYPEPIIDHSWARERALAAYKAVPSS